MSSTNNSIYHAVATGHHKTSEVANNILLAGGNAFDATVAAFLTLSITEPAMASSFAGGFVNIHSAESGNFLIDYFTQTPLNKTAQSPNYTEVVVDFGASQERFYAGPASMAVSGAMAMIHYLVENHCRMTLKELIKPAQSLAVQGVELTNFQALDLDLLQSIFGLEDRGKEIFFRHATLKKEGDIIQMEAYADFLESLAHENKAWVYRGEVAETVVRFCEENGGYLTRKDFEQYELLIKKPFTFNLGNHRISAPGLPSLGGGLLYRFTKQLWAKSVFPSEPLYFDRLLEAFDACEPYLKDGKKLFDSIFGNSSNTATNIIAGGTSHFNILDPYGKWSSIVGINRRGQRIFYSWYRYSYE